MNVRGAVKAWPLMAWFWLRHRGHRGYARTATPNTRGVWCGQHGEGVGYIPAVDKIGRHM